MKTINASNLLTPNLSDVDWAWVAGLLEGEGCFPIVNGYPRITIKMTDQDIIERFARFFDVNVFIEKRVRPHKDVYRTQLGKAKLLHYVVTNIWSYLGKRRREAIYKWYDLWDTKGYTFTRPMC